ncbi:hypothetical protein ABPG73_014469 [Tetrahymena malaccensis]
MSEYIKTPALQAFEQIYETYQKNTNQNLKFQPVILCQIYDELNEKGIQLTEFLAQGGFGMVFEAKINDNVVVVKCIEIQDLNRIEEEVQILKKIKGTPNTCQLLDAFNSDKNTFNFQIFKKYSCDLKNIMECTFENKKPFLLNEIIHIALQVSQAIANLPNMFHSDLKPSNIFYDDLSKSFDLSDFGATKEFKEGSSFTINYKAHDEKYRAPELTDGNLALSKKYDVFSLGLVILEMTKGRFIDSKEAYWIRNGCLYEYLSYEKRYTELNEVIKQMLHVNQNERIEPQELVNKLNELKETIEIKFINSVQFVINEQISQSMIKDFKKHFQEFCFDFKEKKTKLEIQQISVQEKFNFRQFENCVSLKSGWLILNLRQKNIIGVDTENIVKILENYQSPSKLFIDLNDNSICNIGAEILAKILQKYQNLTGLILYLKQNSISEDGAQSLANVIKNYLKITQCRLYFRNNCIGEIGASSIVNAILNYPKNQKLELGMMDCNLGESLKISLKSQIKTCFKGNSLKVEI